MASSDTPDSKLNIEEDPASASFMQKNYSDEPEEGKEEEDPACQNSKRPHTLTEKGLEYQRSLKEREFQRAFRKLKDKLHKLDMDWIDIADPNFLRKERSNIEECRQDLDKAQSEYVPLLLEDESHDVIEKAMHLSKQVVDLRIRIGEKIFQLEREELRSRNSNRSSHSRKTGSTRISKASTSSHISLLKMKALTELAKREVEMKYARIETEKKMEMERKKHEIEEIQRLKNYESAKAEADAVIRLEEEEKNPSLEEFKELQLNEDEKEERIRDYVSSLPDLTSVGSQVPLPNSFQFSLRTAQHPISSSQKVKGTEPYQTDQTHQLQSHSEGSSLGRQEPVATPPPHVAGSNNPYGTLQEVPAIPYYPPVMETQQRGIAEAIAEGMEAARLPTPHLTVFSGNPLDWPTWKVSFETVIEKRTMNSKVVYIMGVRGQFSKITLSA